jgi:hypothetical protein
VDIIHPDLVAGRTIAVCDERENPLGTMRVVAATSAVLTLDVRGVQVDLPAEALLHYNPQGPGLQLIASSLGPDALRRLA